MSFSIHWNVADNSIWIKLYGTDKLLIKLGERTNIGINDWMGELIDFTYEFI